MIGAFNQGNFKSILIEMSAKAQDQFDGGLFNNYTKGNFGAVLGN
ncbi:MAG: hypothetical protein ABJ333_06210 [Algoriphagus sp.]